MIPSPPVERESRGRKEREGGGEGGREGGGREEGEKF